jgi:hypothetical protein
MSFESFLDYIFTGCVKERGSSSADTEKQYNGINPFGIDSYYAEFSDCSVDD